MVVIDRLPQLSESAIKRLKLFARASMARLIMVMQTDESVAFSGRHDRDPRMFGDGAWHRMGDRWEQRRGKPTFRNWLKHCQPPATVSISTQAEQQAGARQ